VRRRRRRRLRKGWDRDRGVGGERREWWIDLSDDVESSH